MPVHYRSHQPPGRFWGGKNARQFHIASAGISAVAFTIYLSSKHNYADFEWVVASDRYNEVNSKNVVSLAVHIVMLFHHYN